MLELCCSWSAICALKQSRKPICIVRLDLSDQWVNGWRDVLGECKRSDRQQYRTHHSHPVQSRERSLPRGIIGSGLELLPEAD